MREDVEQHGAAARIAAGSDIRMQAAKDKKHVPFADRGPGANGMLLQFQCQCSVTTVSQCHKLCRLQLFESCKFLYVSQ